MKLSLSRPRGVRRIRGAAASCSSPWRGAAARTLPVLAVALMLLAGCGSSEPPRGLTPEGGFTNSAPQGGPAAAGDWQTVNGAEARIVSWRWVQPDNPEVRQPQFGWWLVLNIEVRATESPVHVSLWDWACLGAYDGAVVNAVATPLPGVLDVDLAAGMPLSGEHVACDPNPGQAVIVEWKDRTGLGPGMWQIPAREG